jgi:hypothetical protein
MQLINVKMITHPMNWLTLFLMVVIAAAIGHTLLTYLGMQPAGPKRVSAWTAVPAGVSPGQAASGAIDPQTAPISPFASPMY